MFGVWGQKESSIPNCIDFCLVDMYTSILCKASCLGVRGGVSFLIPPPGLCYGPSEDLGVTHRLGSNRHEERALAS